MDADALSVKTVALALLGTVGVALGLVVLLWPGPFAPTDRIPFALVLGVPGALGLLQARWLYRNRGTHRSA